MKALLGLSLMVVLASCGPVAAPKDHVWTVKTPPMVELDSTLRFTVETRTAAGEAIGAIPFVWTVEWVGAQEPVYPGSTFRDLAIRSKGSPGTATVKVFVRDDANQPVEVARSSVQVLGPTPPAR